MVSLTSLLVLAALFSQTSQSIPKTAYLKHIDVWYIVLISYDFLIIVVLVIIENIRLRVGLSDDSPRNLQQRFIRVTPASATCTEKESVESDPPVPPRLKVNTMYGSYGSLIQPHQLLNMIAVIFFPIVCVIFVISFFIIGFYKSDSN